MPAGFHLLGLTFIRKITKHAVTFSSRKVTLLPSWMPLVEYKALSDKLFLNGQPF